jgi:hypothetical protein
MKKDISWILRLGPTVWFYFVLTDTQEQSPHHEQGSCVSFLRLFEDSPPPHPHTHTHTHFETTAERMALLEGASRVVKRNHCHHFTLYTDLTSSLILSINRLKASLCSPFIQATSQLRIMAVTACWLVRPVAQTISDDRWIWCLVRMETGATKVKCSKKTPPE